MSNRKLFAVVFAAVVVLSALALPGVVAASAAADAATNSGEEDDASITVEPTDDGYSVIVDGEVVENVDVNVSTVDDENVSYAGTGTHTTDENGTVALEAPTGNESVEISLEATVDDESVETTATLEPVEEDDEGAENFGSLVSQFVEDEQNDSDGPMGLSIASYVVENNPGNAPDHAGPPSHAGPPGEGNEDRQGPPAHAGGPSDEIDDDESDGNNGQGGGPPEHAGGSSD